MSSKNTQKAVEITTFDTSLQTAYMAVIEQGEEANRANLNFILDVAELLNTKKITQEIAIASMKETAKGIKVGIVVKHGHVASLTIASQIILKFEEEMENQTASKILTLASRVLSDKKAKGAKAHIDSFDTVEELDKNTLSKAEATARDKGEILDIAVEVMAEDITLESVMDFNLDYLKTIKDLRDKKTTELEKLEQVISLLITIAKNSKTA